jgi:hypothetical protein
MIFCYLLILITSACTIPVNEIRANQERAGKIIKAINSYEQDQGQFPAQLDFLVPTYLSQVPKTITGHDFIYQLDNLDGYYLSFYVKSQQNLGCSYIYRLENWDCSFGDPH